MNARGGVAWAVAVCVLAAACASDADSAGDESAGSMSTTPTALTTAPTGPPPERVVPPPLASSVATIDDGLATRMTGSWRPGCPVPLDELRRVTVTHWDFQVSVRTGELVVHADAAEAVVAVFRGLYAARFPIQQIRLVDDFGGDDNRSMVANNTSAFNCRPATGSTRWSEHAYGRAIDINPIQNPYVTASGAVLPPEGAAHAGRDPATPGLITADGPVVAAFDAVGWHWGGRWSSGRDYQHFSATGR